MTSQPSETDVQIAARAKALEADFAHVLARLGVQAGARVGVAVSGGADSMALLLLLKVCGYQPVAFSLDHSLRRESADEVQQVADWCAALGLPCCVLKWAGAEQEKASEGSNVQALARRARYRLLTEALLGEGLDTLLTAHHADDQAETVFMRIARGSGIKGLAAIPEAVWLDAHGTPIRHINTEYKDTSLNSGTPARGIDARMPEASGEAAVSPHHVAVRLLRPLLGFSGESLRGYLHTHSQAWIEDPSNDNTRFERVRVRRFLAGREAATAAELGLASRRLAGLAVHAREAQEIEAWAVDRARSEMIKHQPQGWLCLHAGESGQVWQAYPRAVRLRLLASCMTVLTGADYGPRFEALAALEQDITANIHALGAGGQSAAKVFAGRTLAGVYVGAYGQVEARSGTVRDLAFYMCRESAALPHTPLGEAVAEGLYAASYSLHVLAGEQSGFAAQGDAYTLAPLGEGGWAQLKQALIGASAYSLRPDEGVREMAEPARTLALDALTQLPFPVRCALIGVWCAPEGEAGPRLASVPQLGIGLWTIQAGGVQGSEGQLGAIRPFDAGWLSQLEIKWRDGLQQT